MNEAISMIGTCNIGQIALLIMWGLAILFFIWVIIKLSVIIIKNVIYYSKTKKSNKKTFKKYNFKPKH